MVAVKVRVTVRSNSRISNNSSKAEEVADNLVSNSRINRLARVLVAVVVLTVRIRRIILSKAEAAEQPTVVRRLIRCPDNRLQIQLSNLLITLSNLLMLHNKQQIRLSRKQIKAVLLLTKKQQMLHRVLLIKHKKPLMLHNRLLMKQRVLPIAAMTRKHEIRQKKQPMLLMLHSKDNSPLNRKPELVVRMVNRILTICQARKQPMLLNSQLIKHSSQRTRHRVPLIRHNRKLVKAEMPQTRLLLMLRNKPPILLKMQQMPLNRQRMKHRMLQRTVMMTRLVIKPKKHRMLLNRHNRWLARHGSQQARDRVR